MAQNVEDSLSQISNLRLLPQSVMQSVTSRFQAGEFDQTRQMFDLLVAEGALTRFQVEKLAAGKGAELSLGNYTLLDKLGQGGMGVVLKARHNRMQRLVAIKQLPAKVVDDHDAIARFQREVIAAAQLNHPNIVAAYDADEIEGRHLFVMEYIEGETLTDVIRQGSVMSVPEALECIIQAATGLLYAHQRGVIHRDIKPSNLLLTDEGIVKVLDMGLARFDASNNIEKQADITTTGNVMGTVDYMSPEQAMDTKSADARSDIYSLGITLFFLLTGKPAYTGDSIMSRLLAHANQPIPDLTALVPEATTGLNEIFRRMVAKAPADRFQSMSEVIEGLQHCLTSDYDISVKSQNTLYNADRNHTLRERRIPFTNPQIDSENQTLIAESIEHETSSQSFETILQNTDKNRPPLSRQRQWVWLAFTAVLLLSATFSISQWSKQNRLHSVQDNSTEIASNTMNTPDVLDPAQAWKPPVFSSGIRFAKPGQNITLAPISELKPNTPFTIEFWHTQNLDPNYHSARNALDAPVWDLFLLQLTDASVVVSSIPESDSLVLTAWAQSKGFQRMYLKSGLFTLGQPSHIAMTWDGQEINCFINGISAIDHDRTIENSRMSELVKRNLAINNIGGFIGHKIHSHEKTFDLHGVSIDMHQLRLSSGVLYQEEFSPPESLESDSRTIRLFRMEQTGGTDVVDSGPFHKDAKLENGFWIGSDDLASYLTPKVFPVNFKRGLAYNSHVDQLICGTVNGRSFSKKLTVEVWCTPFYDGTVEQLSEEMQSRYPTVEVFAIETRKGRVHCSIRPVDLGCIVATTRFEAKQSDQVTTVCKYTGVPVHSFEADNQPIHLAYVLDNNQTQLFINGVCQIGPEHPDYKEFQAQFNLMQEYDLRDITFADSIHNVSSQGPEGFRRFQLKLHAAKISENVEYHNSFTPPSSVIVDQYTLLAYLMSEEKGPTVFDYSSNGMDGTNEGGEWFDEN